MAIDPEDVEDMKDAASSFSKIIFHRQFPVIEFTGPAIEKYPQIAKSTIRFFNNTKEPSEFQLSDEDFDIVKKDFENVPEGTRTIREYLQVIKERWEEKTKRVERILKTIPKPIEVWFVVCYPEAEKVVGTFASKSSRIEDNWRANKNKLLEYINPKNQKMVDWHSEERLSLALESEPLTTKILYLPTNTFVSCAAAYLKEANIPISRAEFEKMGVPKKWFQKSEARRTLERSPLALQLANKPPKMGSTSGRTSEAIKKAKVAFKKINSCTQKKPGGSSDEPFNKALAFALANALKDRPELSFFPNQSLPGFSSITPDIRVDVDLDSSKWICIEFHYTTNHHNSHLANYILNKLDRYMKQIEYFEERGQQVLPGIH